MNQIPNKPVTENTEMVADFYAKSFEQLAKFQESSVAQLSEFYEQSFEHLLTTAGWIGAIAGFIAPAIVWFLTKKILTANYDELKSSTESEIEKIKLENTRKLDEEIKKIREDFEKQRKEIKSHTENVEEQLRKEIHFARGMLLFFQSTNSSTIGLKLLLILPSIESLIRSKSNDFLCLALERLLEILQKASKEDLQDLPNNFEDKVKKIREYEQSPFLQSLLERIEDEFKKAKERK